MKPMIIRLDEQGGGQTINVTPAPKVAGSHEIKVELRTSEDGKSLIINGKPVPLPKSGQAGQFKVEGKDGQGVIILNVDGQKLNITNDKKSPKEIKADVIFQTKPETGNKDGAPHVFKAITIDKSSEGVAARLSNYLG